MGHRQAYKLTEHVRVLTCCQRRQCHAKRSEDQQRLEPTDRLHLVILFHGHVIRLQGEPKEAQN